VRFGKLWTKAVVCFVLFCFIVMRSTERGCFRLCSWCLWKALDGGGVHGLGSMTFGLCGVKSS